MTDVDISRVRSSFNRCGDQLEFFETFYERFILASPEVAEKFSNTDMDHQALMMRASLEMMISGTLDEDSGADHLKQVAALHSRKGHDIPASLYRLWMNALIETIKAFDRQFDDQLEQAWRRVLDPRIRFITSRY